MSDLSVILELALMLCAPAVPIAVGVMLRRKFAPQAAEGQEPQGGSKAGRLVGTLLVWAGGLGYALMIVFALNFKGKL